ncbi:N-acetylmuramoyl-L-alanine amidase family protein [Lachnobacterium bovis]|uniref:N-acetylmuramoyl-L-alanine amidase family protein n=1 Tax=Lachnobacterium bovis TaxID=140626 RepID=UPI0004820BD7|nr:N-acetylmuramoyl-L-alanine amidase [Lachnobacterium bovis]
MEIRVLKRVTMILAVIMFFICIWICFLPDMKIQASRISYKDNYVSYRNVSQVLEYNRVFKGKIKFVLPANIEEKDIQIKNDYFSKKVEISFTGMKSNFFDRNKLIGSSDYINEISYFNQDNKGIFVFKLDGIYEIKKQFKKNELVIEFKNPHDIYDKIVVVDAGHGGNMPGAIRQGIHEKDINLAITLELKKIHDTDLNSKIGFYYTRTADESVSLKSRVELANDIKADAFISIHNNSNEESEGSSLSGVQVMYDECSLEKGGSKDFAAVCLDKVVEATGAHKRGLIEGDSIYIIRNSKAPVALVEVGFMTNGRDLKNLNDKDFQIKAAKGIYNAINDFFE